MVKSIKNIDSNFVKSYFNADFRASFGKDGIGIYGQIPVGPGIVGYGYKVGDNYTEEEALLGADAGIAEVTISGKITKYDNGFINEEYTLNASVGPGPFSIPVIDNTRTYWGYIDRDGNNHPVGPPAPPSNQGGRDAEGYGDTPSSAIDDSKGSTKYAGADSTPLTTSTKYAGADSISPPSSSGASTKHAGADSTPPTTSTKYAGADSISPPSSSGTSTKYAGADSTPLTTSTKYAGADSVSFPSSFVVDRSQIDNITSPEADRKAGMTFVRELTGAAPEAGRKGGMAFIRELADAAQDKTEDNAPQDVPQWNGSYRDSSWSDWSGGGGSDVQGGGYGPGDNGGDAWGTADICADVGSNCSFWPIVIDLDGDGIDLTDLSESTVFFDVNNDGYRNNTGWAAATDALLAYDKNEDGVICDFDEISYVGYKEGAQTDLEGLVAFDTNEDGILDENDTEFHKFRVWQDMDQDGETDAGELRTLEEEGILSIELSSDEIVREDGSNTIYGLGEGCTQTEMNWGMAA